MKRHKHKKIRIGYCYYNQCDKKNVKVKRCRFCHKFFCRDHIKPKPSGMPRFGKTDSESIKFMEEYHKPYGHPCPEFWNRYTEKEKQKQEASDRGLDKLIKSKPFNFEEKEDEKPIYEESSHTEEPYNIIKEKPIKIIEEEPHNIIKEKPPKKHKIHFPKIRIRRKVIPRKTTGIIFWLIAIFIVLAVINSVIKYTLIEAISWICLYAAEAIVFFLLIKRMDRIRANTDLSIWGLKILAGVFTLVGVYILFFGAVIFGAFFNLYIFYFFLILTLGFVSIGAFLVFKFKRRSGNIVWVGRM